MGGEEIGSTVDEDVEAAELVCGLPKQLLNLRDAAKIRLQRRALSPQLFDFSDCLVRLRLRLVVMDDDVGAFAGQAHGDRAAYAFGGAGD